jgi:hypothetical protein
MTLCTICWIQFEPYRAWFRCQNTRIPGDRRACKGRGIDQDFATYHTRTGGQVMGHAFEPSRRTDNPVEYLTGKAKCPLCQEVTGVRICPNCHEELEPGFQHQNATNQKILTILGNRRSGKSHYIATILYKLETTGIMDQVGLQGKFMGSSRRHWEERYKKPLFDQQQPIRANVTAEADPDVKKPMIYRISKRDDSHQYIDLYFFDAPGEDQESREKLRQHVQQLKHTSAAIFMLDPLQLGKTNFQQLGGGQAPASNSDDISLVEDIIEEMRINSGDRNTQNPIDIPVAFTLTKLDLVLPFFDKSSAMRHAIDYSHGFDPRMLDSTHLEMQSFLQHYLIYALIDKLNPAFGSRYRLFGVSCIGYDPFGQQGQQHSGTVPYTPACFHVEEPLFWILHQLDFLKVKVEA